MSDYTPEYWEIRYIYGHRVVEEYPNLSEDVLEDMIYREWDEFDRTMAEHDREIVRAALEGYARMVEQWMGSDYLWDKDSIAQDARAWKDYPDDLLAEGKQ